MPTLDEWRALFDDWAGGSPLLASTGDEQPAEAFDALAGDIASRLGLEGHERVLDVGCASGTLTGRWAARAGRVVGLDFSRPLLRAAGGVLTPVQAEAARLPFADGSFDRVCAFNVLHNVPDHAYTLAAIDELLRVVKPGGRVLIGALPDVARKEAWHDALDARRPWYRRLLPRRLRWALKRILWPSSRPGRTRILWFDLEQLAEHVRERGFVVNVEPDPDFADHRCHRGTLVARPADSVLLLPPAGPAPRAAGATVGGK